MRPAASGDALDQSGDLLDAESRSRDVVHEGDRGGAVDEDVVDAVIDQVLTDRVEAPGLERHEHLGADAVRAEHQRRPVHAVRDAYHPSEGADVTRAERRPRPRHGPRDSRLGRLRALEVDPGLGILAGHGSASASRTWVRSWKARTRASTSDRVIRSKARMPNCSTA